MNSKILSASEWKSIHGTFYRAMKLLEITLEKLNFTLIKQEREQVEDPWEEQLDKIWKDKSPQEVKKNFFSQLFFLWAPLKSNREKTGSSNVLAWIRQDFYRWVDSTRIEKSEKVTNQVDLKSILFTFHEVLEGRGDEWAQQLADESNKEVDSWSQEKLEYESSLASSEINKILETIRKEKKLLEGKNWDEVAFWNKFKGNAERGKETLLQIISPNSQQEAGSQEQKPQQPPVEADKKTTNYLAFWIIGGLVLGGAAIGVIWLNVKHTKQQKENSRHKP